ncbi:MAG: preprotein translocase subunit SecE [Chloroflexi bacterium]|jgi:preprotein translocase subunit SecE|nr:preprotein translocase subunit SecE [Chloroflexota bacterium]
MRLENPFRTKKGSSAADASSGKETSGGSRRSKTTKPAPAKKENRIVRYFKEVRAELHKVAWPSRREATNLTAIVLAVTTVMSIGLGLVDWIFSQLFGFIIG